MCPHHTAPLSWCVLLFQLCTFWGPSDLPLGIPYTASACVGPSASYLELECPSSLEASDEGAECFSHTQLKHVLSLKFPFLCFWLSYGTSLSVHFSQEHPSHISHLHSCPTPDWPYSPQGLLHGLGAVPLQHLLQEWSGGSSSAKSPSCVVWGQFFFLVRSSAWVPRTLLSCLELSWLEHAITSATHLTPS